MLVNWSKQLKKQYRILLVEDDPGHAQLIQDYVMMDQTFQVDHVDTLGLFWETYQKFPYDLILMDYRLPDGTGLEALEKIILLGGKTPVVMVTAQGDERIAVQTIQKGAVDYVVKRGDYILSLPSVIHKSIQTHELNQAIERSLEQIRYQAMILNNIQDAVVVWDKEGLITFWNAAAAALFECSAEERLGEHVTKFYFSGFTPPIEYPVIHTEDKEVERRILSKSGKTIWVSSRMTPLFSAGENKTKIGYMDVIRDITERKLMEEKIQAAQARLVQIARLAAVGELSSGIAHRINNPLTTILGESQVLRKTIPLQHPLRDSVEAIHQAGWNAQQVVQSLIDFTSPLVEKLEPVEVNPTLEQAVLLVGAQIQSKGVDLRCRLMDRVMVVKADRSRLIDLWVNLLLQSRDLVLGHDGKSLSIVSSQGIQSDIIVDFRLEAIHLSQDKMDNIFEPNFTGPIYGFGTGMELTICREIVWQFGGQIVVIYEKGDTVFRISLPPIHAQSRA